MRWLLLGLVASVPASAGTLTVCVGGCDYSTIPAAITAASNDDRIEVSAGTWVEPIDINGKDLELVAVEGRDLTQIHTSAPDSIKVRGNAVVRIAGFGVGPGKRGARIQGTAQVLFEDMRFSDFIVNDPGAAVRTDGNTVVEIRRSLFQGNRTTNSRSGGCIYADGDLVVRDSVFTACEAANGGAIYAQTNTTLLEGVQFAQNSASTNGGAVYLNASDTNMDGVWFDSNQTGDKGAGLYVQGASDVSVRRSSFESNHSDNDGAGIYLQNASMNVVQSGFFSNTASSCGAGIYAESGTLSSAYNSFSDGQVDDCGAALYLKVDLTDIASSYQRGVAGQEAGAVRIRNGADVHFIDAVFVDNAATTGGAIHGDGANSLALEGSAFWNNQASGTGGSVALTSSSATSLSAVDTLFTGGDANKGGAIALLTMASANLVNSTLDQNHAVSAGGALYLASGAEGLALSGVTLSSNQAVSGGAIYSLAPAPWSIERSHLSNNIADQGGAIWWGAAGTGALTDSLFTANSAALGGALYLNGGDLGISGCRLRHNSADEAGALWMLGGTLDAIRNDFCDNRVDALSPGRGGAALLTDVSSRWSGNLFSDNISNELGGALFLDGQDVMIDHNHFLGSAAAAEGGAVYATGLTLQFRNNLVAFSAGGYGVVFVSGAPIFDYNAWYGNTPDHLVGASLGNNRLLADPQLTAYSADSDCDNDQPWPASGSPLLGAADPLQLPPDIGAFGGPEGCVPFDVWPDVDGDGFGAVGVSPQLACWLPSGFASNDSDCDDLDATIHPDSWWYADADADGFGDRTQGQQGCVGPAGSVLDHSDCDDTNPDAYPNAQWYADLDGDGFGDPNDVVASCLQPYGYVANSADCDDADPNAYPDAQWYADADADGFGDPDAGVLSCLAPSDTVVDGSDCDDSLTSVHPGTQEVCNGWDDDCDGDIDDADTSLDLSTRITFTVDADGDGHGKLSGSTLDACSAPAGYALPADDCNDGDPWINPGAPEQCDAIDHNCDGDPQLTTAPSQQWFQDSDGDGYGDDNTATDSCLQLSADWVPQGGDCDDSDGTISPIGVEICDALDNDCSGIADDVVGEPWYNDNDHDGYGDSSQPPSWSCTQPSSAVSNGDDCDDNRTLAHPGADEYCNGLDDNCDDQTDENPVNGSQYYIDLDGDGYGSGSGYPACGPSSGTSLLDGDCDDDDDQIYPTAPEACDDVDHNCDGSVDEGAVPEPMYADDDGDGFGDPADVVEVCPPPTDRVQDNTDCDDQNAEVYPGATETWYDNVIQNCGGRDDDQDLDGFEFVDDCNDTDASINPDATEIDDNDIDDDCDDIVDIPSGPSARPVPVKSKAVAAGCGCQSVSATGMGPAGLSGWLGLLTVAMLRRRRATTA